MVHNIYKVYFQLNSDSIYIAFGEGQGSTKLYCNMLLVVLIKFDLLKSSPAYIPQIHPIYIPWAPPSGSSFISLYIPSLVTIQIQYILN